MTESRVKSDPLGATCKSYLRELWREEKLKRYPKDHINKYIEKGLLNEETGITMLSESESKFFMKNDQHFENDYLKGTPDIIKQGVVYDIKCSWSLETFMEAKLSDHEDQLQAYMDLTGCKSAVLVYCLTDTPEKLIEDEIRRMMFRAKDDMLDDIREYCYKQMTFSDIPLEKRVKKFELNLDPEYIKSAYEKIEICRDYYNGLTL